MKSREFIRDHVLPAGGVLQKKDGDHYVFRFSNGKTLVVPVGGRHTEACKYLMARLNRIVRELPKRRSV